MYINNIVTNVKLNIYAHKDDHTAIKKSYKETPSFGHFYTLLVT
jgi:hypothetical protein